MVNYILCRPGGRWRNGASAVMFVREGSLTSSRPARTVFAHHQVVLDALEQALNRTKTKYIRIDGSTPTQERHRLGERGSDRAEASLRDPTLKIVSFCAVTIFQKDASYRCALLSLTAAGQGITLTAATRVVFCELHWSPGVLLQVRSNAWI